MVPLTDASVLGYPMSISCEEIPHHADYRSLGSIPRVEPVLRYASDDNFLGRNLYAPLDCAWLRREAAEALEEASAWLGAEYPHLRLRVLDALRPQRVQEQMWLKLKGTDLERYLAPPEIGSIHSFGMAVDVTLSEDGRELDLGTAFDDMTDLSHPSLESQFVATGLLRAEALNNRRLLRQALAAGGFAGIGHEWWHFDLGDRATVRAVYPRVL